MINRRLPTRAGHISTWESAPRAGRPSLLFLHGNSSCKEVFRHQMASHLSAAFHLVAIDLPGHGQSEPAQDPGQTYTITGYAEVVREVIEQLQLGPVAIVGWSLGGHIALELHDQVPELKGVFITGTPPAELSPDGFQQAFRLFDPELMQIFATRVLSDHQAALFAEGGGYDGTSQTEWALEAVKRCDGRSRETFAQSILENRTGRSGANIVATSEIPIAIVGGEEDYLINWDYVRSLEYRNLWKNRVHLIPGKTHCVMLEDPSSFNALIAQFANEVFSDDHTASERSVN